jgi:hypothetical protein
MGGPIIWVQHRHVNTGCSRKVETLKPPTRVEAKDKRNRISPDLGKAQSSFLKKFVCAQLAEAELTRIRDKCFSSLPLPTSISDLIEQDIEDLLVSDTKMSYILSRFSTILPTYDPAPNPFTLLRTVNGKQWMFFLVCSCPTSPYRDPPPESKVFSRLHSLRGPGMPLIFSQCL